MNKQVALSSFLDPRYKLYPFSSPSAKTAVKEHIKRLATAESNAERQANTTTQEAPQPAVDDK